MNYEESGERTANMNNVAVCFAFSYYRWLMLTAGLVRGYELAALSVQVVADFGDARKVLGFAELA